MLKNIGQNCILGVKKDKYCKYGSIVLCNLRTRGQWPNRLRSIRAIYESLVSDGLVPQSTSHN